MAKAVKREKPKKPKKQSVATKHKLWAAAVAERDNQTCSVCGITKAQGFKLDAHHLLDKRFFAAYRYLPICGVLLCVKCHKWSQWAAHVNPWVFLNWLYEARPLQYQWAAEIAEQVRHPKAGGQ